MRVDVRHSVIRMIRGLQQRGLSRDLDSMSKLSDGRGKVADTATAERSHGRLDDQDGRKLQYNSSQLPEIGGWGTAPG